MEEELSNVIVLNDENGNEVPFEFLDLVVYEDNEYVVLLPLNDDEVTEVVILRVEPCEDDPDMESYVSEPDEEKLEAVFAIFREKFQDEFNFAD